MNQFEQYAKFYDLLYNEKDYKGESDFIHKLIHQNCKRKLNDVRLLDLACGTAKHLLELNALGYGKLSGSDISNDMIKIARQNSLDYNIPLKLYNYSFQDSNNIQDQFDIVLSMFSAVNYLTSYTDQIKTFRNINNLLEKDGLFIFDYWNGNAVSRDFSPVRVVKKKENDKELIRISETTIDRVLQQATVKFHCLYFENSLKESDFKETHQLHYYHFSEMLNLLKESGFDVINMCPFMRLDEQVDAFDWNISLVAKKL